MVPFNLKTTLYLVWRPRCAESPVDIGSMCTARVQCCFKSITMRRYFKVRFFDITFVELMIT